MRYVIGILILSGMLLYSLAEGTVNEELSNESLNNQERDTMLLQRIDFENAFIMGQTIKSGAVYLLKRKKSEIKSMLKARESYREEILEDFSIPDKKGKE